MDLAPIAFFAYKRPQHTLKALKSLSKCDLADQSKLYIFCDGAKCLEDQELVQQVREVVRNHKWCGEVEIVAHQINMGLANSIVTGITKLCQSFGRVIVLEDDLLLSSNFLRYMNAALEKYKHVEQVMQISGYMFPVKLNFSTDAIFLPFITSWGWATWQRAWKHFDPQMSEYSRLKTDRALRYKFDLNSSYPYFKMLEAQIKGKVDSWAIRWYLSTFMQEGLTLYPVHSLVKNIGFDGSGTNCNAASHFDLELSEEEVIYLPELVIENASATDAISKYLYALQSPRELILAKILSIIDKIKNIFARG